MPPKQYRFQKFNFGTQFENHHFPMLRFVGGQAASRSTTICTYRDFGDPVQNFWNLVNSLLCDVAVERQVEITGPDAARFTQFLCCRDLSSCEVGQCKYVLITDQDGGIINDPILLKLAEDHFWLSIADSDVLLWARGVAATAGMDVQIREPDVSPLQLQGPNSRDILRAAFGDAPAELKYYRFIEYDWNGVPLVISRTGWSSELGYEIFLRDGARGDELWDYLMEVGAPMGLHPGHTSSIRRIEAAMLSYHADMTLDNNPFELGMERLVDLDMEADFVSKAALRKISETGVSIRQVGLEFDGLPLAGSNDEPWPMTVDGTFAGNITSAVWSPRFDANIGLGLVERGYWTIGQMVDVSLPDGRHATGKVCGLPFAEQTTA